MNKFYLIMIDQDSYLEPVKVFLNRDEAINYGLKLVDKYSMKDVEVLLYSQNITKSGIFKYEKHLGNTLLTDIKNDIEKE